MTILEVGRTIIANSANKKCKYDSERAVLF